MDNDREREIWTVVLILACVFLLFAVQGPVQAYAVLIGASLYLSWRNFNTLKTYILASLKRIEELFNNLNSEISSVRSKVHDLEQEVARLKALGKGPVPVSDKPQIKVSNPPLNLGMAAIVLLLMIVNLVLYFGFRSEVARLKSEVQLSTAQSQGTAGNAAAQQQSAAVKIPLEDKASFALSLPVSPDGKEKDQDPALAPLKPAASNVGEKLALRCVADDCNF